MSDDAVLTPDALERAAAAGEAAIAAASDLAELSTARTVHLGDRSVVVQARRALRSVAANDRAETGRRVNDATARISTAYDRRLAELEAERDTRALVDEAVDVTLPWDRLPRGARHPLTTIQERVSDVFVAMGYEVAEGPEVEAEWYNFDALNIGPDHPARSLMDTIYIDPPEAGLVLRTHTSPVQIRALLSRELPVYVVCPGRTYRADTPDPRRSPVFSQIEGLAVDVGITMAHLRGTLDAFASAMFGAGLRTRFRPSHFPFTEPSAEFDLECFVCRGAGCRVCSYEGWIEWGGCGMVHPNVLLAGGVDPQRYTGFAFGIGLERTLMFRHGIADIRELLDGDVRFTLAMGADV